MLDILKLESELDKMLSKQTKEMLQNWLNTKNMQKIIFLDIDGVIWTFLSAQASKDDYRKSIDDRLFLLEKIISQTDAKIVLSSSWRKETIQDTIVKLNNKLPCSYTTIQDNLVGITIRGYKYIDKSHKIHLSIPRGVEIKQWIDVNVKNKNTDVSDFRYVILDDDDDMLLEQKDNFIQCQSNIGLTREIANKAIQILNNL